MQQQYRKPKFARTERTPAQRWETVSWAFAAGSADGGGPSPELVQLYKFYVAGDIDLAMVRGELDRLYPQYPSGDPMSPHPPAPAEMAALVQEIAALPPRQHYIELDLSTAPEHL